jgi:hypothetical protein
LCNFAHVQVYCTGHFPGLLKGSSKDAVVKV